MFVHVRVTLLVFVERREFDLVSVTSLCRTTCVCPVSVTLLVFMSVLVSVTLLVFVFVLVSVTVSLCVCPC